MRLSWILVVVAASCTGAEALAQSVVTDPTLTATTQAGLAQNAAKLAEQLAQLRQQVAHAQAMVEQAKSQYRALTGARNLGRILNDPVYRDYLPADWRIVYDGVRTGGYSGLTGTALSVRASTRVFDTCAATARDPDPKRAHDALVACQAAAAKPAQDKAIALEAYDRARGRLSQIEALMGAINATADPKAIAELQARIAAEEAAIQNEQTKLQMFQMAAQAESGLQQQRQREIEARTWSSRGGLKVEPLTFR